MSELFCDLRILFIGCRFNQGRDTHDRDFQEFIGGKVWMEVIVGWDNFLHEVFRQSNFVVVDARHL